MKDIFAKAQVNPEPITAEDAIKEHCSLCLAADGAERCTETACSFFPFSPYPGRKEETISRRGSTR